MLALVSFCCLFHYSKEQVKCTIIDTYNYLYNISHMVYMYHIVCAIVYVPYYVVLSYIRYKHLSACLFYLFFVYRQNWSAYLLLSCVF